MILGTKGRYAVMAMVELARRGGEKPVTLADIAASQEIPLPYLEQIFNKLKKHGLVHAVRGPGGGYQLAQGMDAVTVADVVNAVDEPMKMTRCGTHESAGCMTAKTRCLTHDLWDGLGEHIQEYLRSVTLADVCARRVRVGRSSRAMSGTAAILADLLPQH